MIEYLLAGFAMLLFTIRIVMYKQVSVWLVIVELTAAITMMLALAFFVLMPSLSIVTTTTITGGGTYNIISNSIANNGLIMNSWMPSLLYMFVIVFELCNIVFLFNDIPVLFFPGSKIPRTPKMGR